MSVSIDEDLYHALKATAGPRGMSRFIAEAVQEKLGGARDELRRQYVDAGRDEERRRELAGWDAVSAEGWD